MQKYHAADSNLWSCRPDAQPNEYFCHSIACKNLEQDILSPRAFGLLGFASDLGVQNNFGRLGAKLAPALIRQFLSRLSINNPIWGYDCGDVQVDNLGSLRAGQQLLAEKVQQLLTAKIMPIVLGGGHETAYGHYLGLAAARNEPVAILNFDAHFDLRPVNLNDEGTSGTPFRQIYNYCQTTGQEFNYYCIGIQPRANVQALYDFAAQSACRYLEAEVVNTAPQQVYEFIAQILKHHKHVYVSVCLDVFHYSFAPGVSAPQPLGISPNLVLTALRQLRRSQQVLSLDVVELNPNYDIDNHTARLAANLIAEFIYA